MLRYGLAALALKAFSMNDASMKLYRHIGNVVGASRRQHADLDVYTQRGNLLVDLYRRYGALEPGAQLMELGTGWMHWYAVYLRLFFDVRVVTLDIWDNRQFAAFRSCFSRLRARLENQPLPGIDVRTLDRMLAARDFDEVYEVLSFNHVIVPDGSMRGFADSCFDSVFSMHVLEHVPRDLVPALVKDMYRTLKPGCVTIHQIGIDDHLAHYDRSASRKQYVAYSDRTWSRLFENKVQYFNRLQMSDWIGLFEQAGFTLLEKKMEATTLDGLSVSPAFRRYTKEDLACTILTLAFRRPELS